MATAVLTDFYYKGKHYDKISFDLNANNKNDAEIVIAFARKMDEYEKLIDKTT